MYHPRSILATVSPSPDPVRYSWIVRVWARQLLDPQLTHLAEHEAFDEDSIPVTLAQAWAEVVDALYHERSSLQDSLTEAVLDAPDDTPYADEPPEDGTPVRSSVTGRIVARLRLADGSVLSASASASSPPRRSSATTTTTTPPPLPGQQARP